MKRKVIVEHIHIENRVEDDGPPPADLKPTHKTLEEWLSSIAKGQKPPKPIANYSIRLFEGQNECVLDLFGFNRYGNDEKIDYRPADMYFILPMAEYKDLTYQQLVDIMAAQLQDLTKTENFKTSFLADANTITLNGVKVWVK